MTPRRRKSVEPSDAPEPKRRVTRSSTKENTANTEATRNANRSTSETQHTLNPPAPSQIPSKSRTSKSKLVRDAESSTPKPLKAKDEESGTSHEINASTPTDLTITHASFKNPIICQTYEGLESSFSRMIFTHGAGGTLSAPAVVNFCTGYSSRLSILAFQGSMHLGSRVKGFHACISHLESEFKESQRKNRSPMTQQRQIILGGRSMGARAAVIAATEQQVNNLGAHLVLVSYPLQGPKDIRDQILLDLDPNVSVLFIVGDKDPMCPLDMLIKTREKMKAKSWLIVAEGMNHGMHGGGAKKEKALGEEMGRLGTRWVSLTDKHMIDKRVRWDEEEGVVRVLDL